MFHLDNTSGVPEMPEPKDEQSISPRWFGESQEQGGISWPGADWFNVVQAELLNLLKAAGIEPDKRSYDQLSKAIPELGDAKFRSDVANSDGAKLVGGIGFVSPEMFGYLQGVSPDAVPYYQKAVDEGHARGLPVRLTGKYYATTYPHKVTLPGDDGTAYPGWVAAGNDANIAAEPENHIYAAIRLYPDSVVIGDSMQNCALIGDWDSDAPTINNN